MQKRLNNISAFVFLLNILKGADLGHERDLVLRVHLIELFCRPRAIRAVERRAARPAHIARERALAFSAHAALSKLDRLLAYRAHALYLLEIAHPLPEHDRLSADADDAASLPSGSVSA